MSESINYYKHNNPVQSYINISTIIETLLAHCEKHNIKIWAEYGTLIGWDRHNGVIPWDYDGDFGILVEDKDRLIKTFKDEHSSFYNMDIGYYNDNGCLAVLLNGNDNDLVDIIFFQDLGDRIDSLQSVVTKKEYPCNYDYCYQKEDLFPLKKTLFLGHNMYIPNNWKKVLEITYKDWKMYPNEFSEFIDPKYCSSAFKNIQELNIDNFKELVTAVENLKEPFILRKTKFLDYNFDNFEKLINKQKEIYGYKSSITWDFNTINGTDIWNSFKNNTLKINIVDSPTIIDDDDVQVLDPEWKDYARNKLKENNHFALTWILTNSPKITHFHTDPEFAGGYMKLLEGEKIWWCIKGEDLDYLVSKGNSFESLRELPLFEILKLENFYLWGKIFVNRLEDGDFLWFPLRCLHKVTTLRNSYGFGGYL